MSTTCVESVVPAMGLASSSEPLGVLAARAACALEQSLQHFTLASDQNLGHLEVQAAQDVQRLLREAIERGAQAKADATPPLCPVCQQKLTRLSADHREAVVSRYAETVVCLNRHVTEIRN